MAILTPQSVAGLPAPWRHVLPGTGDALRWLRAHDWGIGTRLAFGPGNTATSAAILQAAMLNGCTIILIQGRLHADERDRQVAAARADAVIADGDHPLLDQIGTHRPPAWDATRVPECCPPVPATTPALLLATSGTTGAPRLVRLSQGALAQAATMACRRLDISAADTWLTCLPLDHIGGTGIVLRSLVSGCQIDLVERFDAAQVSARLTAGATIVSLVPTMLHRLIAMRGSLRWPATLRCLLIGGGPLSSDLIDRCTALGLAPSQTYGLTEAASQVCTLTPAEAATHPGTAGRALDGMTVAIRDAAGIPLSAGQDGRIWLRGGALCDGYETPDGISDPRDPDGWFPTGDVGRLDADGFLTVLGRHDEVIVSGGENIAPAEVEAALERHPAVAQAAVYARPDAEWGQVVCAALVARDDPVPVAELDAYLVSCLSRFKRPRRIDWVPALPTTANGKIRRGGLAAWLDGRR